MSDIQLGGQTYRLGKLDARKQFHVARRLAPLLAEMGAAPSGRLTDMLGPVAQALSKMSDADVDFVLDTCLAACSIQQGQSFAPVFTRSGLMFDFIDMATMTQLAVKVIQENMGGFFAGAEQASGAAARA